MQRRRLLALAMLAALRLPAAPAPGAAAAEPLTPKQRNEVRDLVARFRRAGDEPARAEAADGLLAIGPGGAAALLDAVNKALDPLVARYRADFLETGRAILRQRLADHDPDHLDALQETVRSLSREGGLTKKKIVTKGDPALKELQAILALAPKEVLQADAHLAARRERILALGRHRDRAIAYLAEHLPAARQELSDPRPTKAVLEDHEALSGLLAVAESDNHRRILIENDDLGPRIRPEEARGIRRMNQIRIIAGLKPLRIDVRLCNAARDHSKDMVEKGFFSHTSPVPGKKTPWERARRFDTTAHAENIARGTATGAGAIQQWWHSPGHHTNMMGDHSHVGLGRYKETWTQLFG